MFPYHSFRDHPLIIGLDATCVCTSSSQPCLPLAQHLVSLHPTMNQLFNTNYTLTSLALSLWLAQGDPRGGNCASQAMLVDVSPSLSGSHPNRTAWAQSALLWNVAESEDLDTVGKMRDFVIKAPWKDLESSDGPINSAGSSFSTTGSGFLFDFAAQTVAPAASVSFNDGGQPTEAQRQRVGTVAQAVLDRMYTFSSGEYSLQFLAFHPDTVISCIHAKDKGTRKLLDKCPPADVFRPGSLPIGAQYIPNTPPFQCRDFRRRLRYLPPPRCYLISSPDRVLSTSNYCTNTKHQSS